VLTDVKKTTKPGRRSKSAVADRALPPVEESWNRIRSWFSVNAGGPAGRLAASEAELIDVQNRFEVDLPEELISWWRLPRTARVELAPGYPEDFTPEQALTARDEALQEFRAELFPIELFGDEPFANPPIDAGAGSPSAFYSPLFVPVLGDRGDGSHLFIDLRRGPEQGCVMGWTSLTQEATGPKWKSLTHLFHDLAEGLYRRTRVGLWSHTRNRIPVTAGSGWVMSRDLYTGEPTWKWACDVLPPEEHFPGPRGNVARGFMMLAGQTLKRQSLTSASDEYSLVHQHTGDLVFYNNTDGRVLWSSHTYGSSVGGCSLGPDGNLVIYDVEGYIVWQSGTAGNPGAVLIIEDGGNAVIYSADRVPLWSIGTGSR
jgi:hypothetical protein